MTRDMMVEILDVSIKRIGAMTMTGTSVPMAQVVQTDLRALRDALAACPAAPPVGEADDDDWRTPRMRRMVR
jgi:hypothetical protein